MGMFGKKSGSASVSLDDNPSRGRSPRQQEFAQSRSRSQIRSFDEFPDDRSSRGRSVSRSKSKKSKKRGKSKSNLMPSGSYHGDSYGAGGYESSGSNMSRTPKKQTRIKKMRMRMLGRSPSSAEEAAQRNRDMRRGGEGYVSPDAPLPGIRSDGFGGGSGGGSNYDGYYSEDTLDTNSYGYNGNEGGFQLDNIPRPTEERSGGRGGVVSAGVRGGASMLQSGGRKVLEALGSEKRVRVKPFHAFPSPRYLNESELYECMMLPSENVEFLNSFMDPSTKATRRVKVSDIVRRTWGSPREDGRIGSLKVEVLGCVGLARAKPEVSVYIVVGDCAFSSDIIQGVRSPMWPNSSKRAAVFPLHHAYAKMFVGVFDVRQRKNSEADHFCGRIAIDIPMLRPDSEYDISFPLRASSFIYDRRARGVVRLRFSLHWFSERAVLLSYLKRPRNPLAFSKQAKKQPTIPCGDPKTFRNVAVTVHGQDFPGKYTRASFRATMREFNLYQQNLRFLFKVIIMDVVMYENPFMSLYLFTASMHCVWLNSVSLVPPYFVGWIIYMFVENYFLYNVSTEGTLGYKPLSILEIAKGAVRDGQGRKHNFGPLFAQKRFKKNEKDTGIELLNHREFPFSERFEYHKFSASEGIAPSPAAKNKKGGKGGDLRTTRRLSIYVAPIEKKEEESEEEEDSDVDSLDDKDDDDSMMDQGDDGFGDMDSDEEVEDEENGGKGRIFDSGKASTSRRIRVGPPQNSEKSGRKVPPQVHLSRVEHMLHKASKNISVEMVNFPAPHVQKELGVVNSKAPLSDVVSAQEKQNFDEFDKMLGYRVRTPNPILRITSSFLGPLMRIIRIFIYATRIAFNLTTWHDPFLSFWVLVFLSTLTFILLIFPWRAFFFISSCVLFGPQNIAVRKFLEKRAKEKEQDDDEAKNDKNPQNPNVNQNQSLNSSTHVASAAQNDASAKPKAKKSRWGFTSRSENASDDETNVTDQYESPRPAFFAHTRPTRRNQVPRDVAVPYFRFRKDRFYDWPPDPTVSRAVPIMPHARAAALAQQAGAGAMDDGMSSHHGYDEPDMDSVGRADGIRQRKNRRTRQEEEDMYGYE